MSTRPVDGKQKKAGGAIGCCTRRRDSLESLAVGPGEAGGGPPSQLPPPTVLPLLVPNWRRPAVVRCVPPGRC